MPPRVTILADGSEVVLNKKQKRQLRLEEALLEKERNDQRLREALLQLKQQVASSIAAAGTQPLNTTSSNIEERGGVVGADQEPSNSRKHPGSGPVVTRLNKSALAPSDVTPHRWAEYLRTVAKRERPGRPPSTVNAASLAVSVNDDDYDDVCG
jgi:hypothetical protein